MYSFKKKLKYVGSTIDIFVIVVLVICTSSSDSNIGITKYDLYLTVARELLCPSFKASKYTTGAIRVSDNTEMDKLLFH